MDAEITDQNTVLMVWPTWVTAPTATTAIRLARSAYSIRSWPRSSRATLFRMRSQVVWATSSLHVFRGNGATDIRRAPDTTMRADPRPPSHTYAPAAVVSLVAIELKITFTCWPAVVSAATHTSAISAVSNAYSIK